ncbi:hypothetical protein [Micromonospora chalcea]|uniref:hypothetical protein n=1 Tax=Micromonospora chalcea TaxID=1874 RepID=UPI003D737D36
MKVILIGQVLTTYAVVMWAVAGLIVVTARLEGREPARLARAIYHELRPFYRAIVLTGVVLDILGGVVLLGLVYCGVGFWLWSLLRDVDDDDDRWKRRRRNLARKVQVVDGQLTVVPAGAR